jgi:hypothetical protein
MARLSREQSKLVCFAEAKCLHFAKQDNGTVKPRAEQVYLLKKYINL